MGTGSSSTGATENLSIKGGQALLDRGLELANFIISDRAVALEVLRNALSKLQVQRSREAKRAYWRSRYLKRKITRMVRSDGDTLQWLIYFEAERYEREQEQAGEQTEREIVIRYIKYLAQITTTMSSFHVNVGVNRLLRNYSTAEVREAYEWVTQHFTDDQVYRRAKAALMAKVNLRFGDLLKTCNGHHGELRFETLEDQACWVELVRDCLKVFTPWSTDQTCQSLSDGTLSTELRKKTHHRPAQDTIEITHCHVFLHPSCYRQVTEALGLDPPESRLAVPRFFVNGGKSGTNSPPIESAGGLTEQELKETHKRLSIESERRSRAKPKFFKILVDGIECSRLVNENGSRSQCQINESANLIEIWTGYEGEDLLLAIHWIEYTRSQGIAAASAIVDLPEGRELFLEIAPQSGRDDSSYSLLSIESSPASAVDRFYELVKSRSFWLQRFPRYALLFLFVFGIGWTIASIRTSSEHRAAIERLDKELAQEKEARAAVEKAQSEEQKYEAYLLTPDESREGLVRGSGGVRESVIALSEHSTEVILGLPIPRDLSTPYKAVLKPFLKSREILAESFPRPSDPPQGSQLKFILPTSFVQAGKYYVVELYSIGSIGRSERIHTFTFYVSQK